MVGSKRGRPWGRRQSSATPNEPETSASAVGAAAAIAAFVALAGLAYAPGRAHAFHVPRPVRWPRPSAAATSTALGYEDRRTGYGVDTAAFAPHVLWVKRKRHQPPRKCPCAGFEWGSGLSNSRWCCPVILCSSDARRDHEFDPAAPRAGAQGVAHPTGSRPSIEVRVGMTATASAPLYPPDGDGDVDGDGDGDGDDDDVGDAEDRRDAYRSTIAAETASVAPAHASVTIMTLASELPAAGCNRINDVRRPRRESATPTRATIPTTSSRNGERDESSKSTGGGNSSNIDNRARSSGDSRNNSITGSVDDLSSKARGDHSDSCEHQRTDHSHFITRIRDNDMRMFLLERGLSQDEVHKILPVMRRDPQLMSDMAVLAARMQAIADLLESSASWYTPGGGPSARNSDLLFPPPPLLDGDGFRESNEDMVAAASGKRSTADAHAHEVEAAVAEIDGAINGTMEKLSNGLFAETAIDDFRTRNGQLQPTIIGDGMGDGGVASIDDADGGLGELDWVQDGREGEEGARLHAYQLISSEPRLLLIKSDKALAVRLRFLLDHFPGLRGSGNVRLLRAACLLTMSTAALKERLQKLTEMLPEDVNVQALVCHAPYVLSRSTARVRMAVSVVEQLVPGVRMSCVLRSAPRLLAQSKGVVEERLGILRDVLGLSSSPQAEREMLLSSSSNGTNHSTGEIEVEGGECRRERMARKATLARFANVVPHILVMDPRSVRGKIERLERLLPGVDGLAVVSSRPQLLGFDVRTTVARKVSRLREILGLQADIAVAVARCPSLLTMSSENAAGKLEKLQEALPSALEASAIVAKEPRIMSLDTGSTVPRKLEGLAHAFAVHAEANDEEAAEMITQVLKFNPNALRYDPATLAAKLVALREAGVPPPVIASIVRDAPRCLAPSAETLARRVSVVRETFPSISLTRLLGKAPCLLRKNIVPSSQVALLRELFPNVDPTSLVKGAPMLLLLSHKTLRIKSDAWRHALKSRLDVDWDEAVAEFPQMLCQGLGRAARIQYLLHEGSPLSQRPRARSSGKEITEKDKVYDENDSCGGGATATCTATGARKDIKANTVGGDNATMAAKSVCHEICRRIADFAADNPGYPSFVASLLAVEPVVGRTLDRSNADMVGDRSTAGEISRKGSAHSSANEACNMFPSAATSSVTAVGFRGNTVAGDSAPFPAAAERADGAAICASASSINTILIGNQTGRRHWQSWHHRHQGQQEASSHAGVSANVPRLTETAVSTLASRSSLDVAAPLTSRTCDTATSRSRGRSSARGDRSSAGMRSGLKGSATESTPLMRERALGAAMTAAAKESGGAAAALLLLPQDR